MLILKLKKVLNYMFDFIASFRPRTVIYLTLALGMLLTLSSFYIEHVLHEIPCPMCIWQRYSHMTLWAVALFSLLLWPYLPKAKFYIFVFICVGMYSGGVGLYQGAGQQGWVELPQSCTGGSVELLDADNLFLALTNVPKPPSCKDIDFEVFGLTLAWWNFIIMSIMVLCLTIWLSKNKRKTFR
jgi:disulfide bond formation protein DsbB